MSQLAPVLRAQLVAGSGRLVSLFYGTGALEQAAGAAATQVAAEANADLRCLYGMLQKAPESVATALRGLDTHFGRTRDAFVRVRALHAEQLPPLERASRFLWLSAMSFNGLWRVNKQGLHNVPPDPARLARAWPFPSLKQLADAASALDGVRFVPDWREAARLASEGDLVVADPPYLGGFDAYTPSGFGLADHQELAACLQSLRARGCRVLAFNSPAAEALYAGWADVEVVHRSGRMSSDPSRRQRVAELLVLAGSKPAKGRAA